MSPFRGSDDSLDREIATLERIAKVRLRRTSAEFRELERDLRELRREKVRRRGETAMPVGTETESETETASS